MRSNIVAQNDRIFLYVNNQVVDPLAYMTYNPSSHNYHAFYTAGVKLFSLGIYMGNQGINSFSGLKPFRNGFFSDHGKYGFEEVEKDIKQILSHHPDAMIIPRIYLDCPIWWEAENPGELCRDYKGEAVRQSFASEKWRKDALSALQALIDYLDASPWKENVIGYHIAAGGTEEWAYHRRFGYQLCDYSACNREKYHRWLTKKYRDIAGLNAAWGTDFPDFEKIPIPLPLERAFCGNGVLRDPSTEMHCIDYYLYHNHLIADTIQFFCKNIKEYTHFERITGVFYGYICEIMNNDIGHHCLHEVLDSEYIDFLASPHSYLDARAAGIDWPFMSAVDSASLHHKLWFVESDIRTNLTQPLAKALPDVVPDNAMYDFQGVWKGPETKELSLSLLKKGIGKILTGQLGTWWFDMWGGWFDDPDYMSLLKQAHALISANRRNEQTHSAEIAVFIDDDSYSYFGLDSSVLYELVYKQRKALGTMGAPYHIYLTGDIADPGFDSRTYKLFIFLNSIKICPNVAEAINTKLKKDNNTLLWIYMADLFDTKNRPKEQNITGFQVSYDKTSPAIQGQYKGVLFPDVPVSCPRFLENQESGAKILASDSEKTVPTVLYTHQKEYNSIFSVVPNLPARLLTDIAVLCGVHVYSYTEDVLYADGRYLCIHAASGGNKRFYLPYAAEVFDALSGQKLADSCYYFDFKLEQYETRLFLLKTGEGFCEIS